jgi:Fe-S-cluster containining protein
MRGRLLSELPRERLSLLPACVACQACCCEKGTPLITAEERNRIAEYSGRDEMTKWGEFYLMKAEPCPYFCNGYCSVHPVKPRVCVAWPVTLKVGEDGRIEPVKVKAKSCPAAITMDDEFIELAVKLLVEMPDSYKHATASLTQKFGFEVEPLK